MTTQDLKKAIENLAKEENISFMDACKAMQGAAQRNMVRQYSAV